MANLTSLIKSQNYGVEIELTGISRENASKVIASYFGNNTSYHLGGGYDTWTATDSKGRTWKCMSDASIACQTSRGVSASARSIYACEVVTPILQYEDLEDLQEIVRELRRNGAIANYSTGIHVHVDGANHTPVSLYRMLNLFTARQNLFYEAIEISDNRKQTWCKPISNTLRSSALSKGIKSKDDFEQVWYSSANDSYSGRIDHSHYNTTRYHGINLHAFFTKGTVEFRLFNGTTHAGKIKAYVQFCLGLSAWAMAYDNTKLRFADIDTSSKAQKFKAMNQLLDRFGLVGNEFNTARTHLTKVFTEGEVEVA